MTTTFGRVIAVAGLSVAGLCVAGLSVVLTPLISPADDWARSRRVKPPTEAERTAELEYDTLMKKLARGGEHFSPMRMVGDYPGVVDPVLSDANQATLAGSTEVVGVSVNGQACAFVLEEMDGPLTHVANLLMNDVPVSVTYCNLSNCVRVLTENASALIPLNVGGLNIHNRMVLKLRGVRYDQSSKAIPLQDLPYTRTSWAKWKSNHPSTKIWLPKKTN